ncbi:hypothetical protein Tco_0611472 [Tanacetum coccineum]
MLQICPRLPGQKFEDPPLEEEILSFIRDLGHTGEIKILIVSMLTTCINPGDHLLLSLIGSTTVGRHALSKWRTRNLKRTMKCDTQIYGAILPDELTNQEILDSKAYKEYYAVASGAEPPKVKIKYKKKANEPVTPSKKKTAPASKGSKLKSPAKVAKTDKKKQPAMMQKNKGLAVLYKVALTETEQIKLATKRSKTQFHSSHASGSGDGVDTQSKVPDEQQQKDSGTDEGAGDKPEVPDVPKYDLESDEESWTFSQDEEDADEETDVNDDSDETESDNDGDDLTHPNLLTYKADDEEEEQEKADDEEMSSDQRVSTPPEYKLFEEEEENK